MSPPVRANVVITGLVQGVFFRSSAMEEAQRLGLSGFVQNLPDGSVEAVVEGPEPAVEQFITWARVGPPAARVEDVRVKRSEPRGEFRTFTIIR